MANVKVALRVRPLSKREIAEEARIILNVDNKIARIRNIKLDYRADGCGDTRDRFLEFGFDYCYCSVDADDPNYASQEVVFQDLGTTVLSEAIQGYNVCLFAYGQTGSGKTYTMMGTPTSIGLTPRICEGLFCYNADSLGAPSSCRIEVSFLEIYNERVRDLLHEADQKKPYTLRVREHPEKGPYVQGLSKHVVTTYEQVVALLEEGMENRITAATHIHDASSRSHAIFTIHYTQAILEDNCPSEINSKVNLVDLAGSERASPNYCKDRLTEGSNINRSLVTLGIVISALAQSSQMSSSCQSINSIISDGDSGIQGSSPSGSSISGSKRQPFVPYRDSILTWLLKDSLGGNSKTIMIATVSPSSSSYNETMSTLRYASNAKNIINKPRVNEDAHVKLIRELREEINRLKAMLRNFEMRTVSPSFSEERDGNLTELVRQNELKIEQLTKDWTDKWTDKAALMEQYSVDINQGKARLTIDSGLPHLIAMDDDILSTGVVIYHLKEGTTNIGKGDHDIVLQGECINQDHCIIENNFGVVELRPVSGALCMVNGQKVTEVCRLSQGAVIVLGKSHTFRFNHPAQAAVLRQMRSGSQTSFISDHSLDWLDLSGDYSSSTENSVILNASSTEILSGENRQRITELESSYEQQLEEQKRYVDHLKRQIQVSQVKVEKELEQEQTLLNQQIQENQQWLVKERQRLTTVCQQRKESAAQTEAKTYAEVEIQNCVQTEIQPSPEEADRKQLLQLELLRKCSLRKAERNIRRKRVKFQLERIVKKQKLLEAKKTLQQLEAACWINDDALKPIYLPVPKLQDPAVRSTSLERSRSSNIISYYKRRSLPWTLQTLPTYSAILKRKCRSELVQRSKTCEKKKPLRAVSIDCLHKISSTCVSSDEVENESSCVETPSAQAEKRTINVCINHDSFGATLFPSDPQMSKKRQKMDKAGGRLRGLSSRPTEPPKKKIVRPPVNTGTKDTKLKATKNQSLPTAGIPRKNTVLEKSRLTAKSEGVKSPPEKLGKNSQSSPVPGKRFPSEASTVKTARRNMTSSTPNTKSKPNHGANKISSSANNVSKVNNHHKDATERRWMSTEGLSRGLSRPNLQRLDHWKKDDNGDSSDSESFYSVDSLSSAYASALNEQLKQEERERQKHSRRDSDSEDSQMSQDSLVERENKKDRQNKRRYNRYKTIVTHSNSSKSLTEDANSHPLVTTGSVTTGFSKSFSLDSLADTDEVPEVDSSEELPAEIFWTLQSPRCLNINDDNPKNVDSPNTEEEDTENTVLEKSASFYLNDDATRGYKVTSTTHLNVPDVKSQQIHISLPVIYGEETLHGLSSETCVVEVAVNALDQDFSCFDNEVTKPDSDITQDETNEALTKNIVIKSKPRTSPDIQEELNALYSHCPETLSLNECNIEQNQPNLKVQCHEDQKSVECISCDNDCHAQSLGELSKLKFHSDCHDLSDSLMESSKSTQKSFPNIDKNYVDLQSIGSSRRDATTMPQLFLEPTIDDVCNKDDVSVNTCVNSDLTIEPKEVNIKTSQKQENCSDEELTECDKQMYTSMNTSNLNTSISTISFKNENEDTKKDIHSKHTSNGLLPDRSCSDEECKPQKMFVLHLDEENDEMHDHTDSTCNSVDLNVTQGGLSTVQTDYLNDQSAVLSDSLESENIQKMVSGITNALQEKDQQICSGFATTDMVSQVTANSDALDLNDNRDWKQGTQQRFSDTYNDGDADISMSVVLTNQPLPAVKNTSQAMSVEMSEAINVNLPKICNHFLQHIENLNKDDSRDSRGEVCSDDSHKDTENVFLSDSSFLHSCTSLETDGEPPSRSPVTNLNGLPLNKHSSTIPGEYINNPEHKETKVNGCFCKPAVNILSNPSEILQLTPLSEKAGELQHNVLDINSNQRGVSCSSCKNNIGSLSSLNNAQCALTSNSPEMLEVKNQNLSADSQQLHGLDTNRPYYTSELLNCNDSTNYCISNSKQLQEIYPSGQDMDMKSSQSFKSLKNDHRGLPSGSISTVTNPDNEDDENAWNETAEQKHQTQELKMATMTSETEGSFPLIKELNKNYGNGEKTNNDDGKQCASKGKLEEPSPNNKQAMIKYDTEANHDKEHRKDPAKEKHNYVTNAQGSTTLGIHFQKHAGDTESNEPSISTDLYCAVQPVMQDYDTIMQSGLVSEAANIQYKYAKCLANNSDSEQSQFDSKSSPCLKEIVDDNVKGINNETRSSRILHCKEGKIFSKVKSGESELGILLGTGIHVTQNESIQEGSAVYTEENVLIPTLLNGFPSTVSSLAEEECISFMSTPDRQGNIQEAIEENEQTYHNVEKESDQIPNFNVQAQEKIVMGQKTLNKLLCENTIVQKNGSPLTNNEFKDKTRVSSSPNPEKATCESESAYSSLPYSTNTCSLSTATAVNSPTYIGESNEELQNLQNDTNICQYRLSKTQAENEQTEMFLSCQPSNFRPCQETRPMEKGSKDYGSGHTCEGSVSTSNEWDYKCMSKSPNFLMDKGTLQSTEVLDRCGVNIISGHVLEQSDPSLHVVYRIRDNEGIKKNSCRTKADCEEYLQLNRSPEISSGDEDTETSSSLASSGFTSLKIRSPESLSVLTEGKLEMNGAVNTEDSDFSHHAFSDKNTSLHGGSSPSLALGKAQLTESPMFPRDGLTSHLNSETSPQRLGSSSKSMCNELDHSNLGSKHCLPHNENVHFNDECNSKKAYIPIKLVKDSSQQTQTSLEEMAENTEGLHFSSSDINPFVHSWQQEVSPRAGWRNCSFNSATDVSSSKIQATAARLIRCSSVDEGLNSHSSPFNSHLSSYANAKPASSTISSFGENDSRPDLNSLEGFQDHLLDNTVDLDTTNDLVFVGTRGSQLKFEEYSQLDEIMILYTSESETCNENDQRKSYEHRTHTKPRYRKPTKHQRSSTDVLSSRKMKSQNPVSWSNVQSMSMHLSQLLQETSELLGNLSQHHVEKVPCDATRLQNHAAESRVEKIVKDSFTQTYEDKGIQTDKLKTNSAPSYCTKSNSFLSPSEINVIVKVVGADSSTLIPDNIHLTGAQNGQAPKGRTQSLPNLHGYVASKPADHVMSKSRHVRGSVPFLNGSKEHSAGSFQISSPTSSPVSVILNQDSSGGSQTLRCHTASQGNTMMVDRASSPILTLRASKKPFNKCESEKHSSENNLEKVSRHRKRRERGNCDLQITSSQTETDRESSLSFDRENSEHEYKAVHCSSLRESPKRRIASHKVPRYKSEGCILQNKYSPITNQFSSNSEISGYEDRDNRKDFRFTQPKKMPTTTYPGSPPWECPQSRRNLSQVEYPVLDRHRQPLTKTTMKEYGTEENDLASTTIASSNLYVQNENCQYSPSQVSGIDLQLREDCLSVVESECNTDVLLGKEPTLANSCKSNNYSLQDLPLHNKFSNWSGVHGSSPRNVQLLMSYPNLSIKEDSTCMSQEVMDSRSREIERLQKERAKVMSAIHLEMNPQPLTVQLAEAKLSYGIGETDALLRVIQTGKMDSQDQVSIKKQLYDRHKKVIENLRKEREERLQSFRRSRSLSPQKQLSASQTSLLSLRESELPSRRREYLQQLRRDVVDSTRIQEPRRKSAQCPSEIEAMLKDYQKAREEARTEIARARDKLRERAEQEKRRLMQSTLQKEDTKMKTLVSTSTLFTNSSLSLSSGPTSGYNSGMTATPAKGSKGTFQETLATGVDLEPGSGRGRSGVRNCYLLVPTQNPSVPDPNLNQLPSNKISPVEASLTRSTRPHGSLLVSTPVLYQDLATQVQASAMAEVMAACSYDTRNLFNGQAAAGWIYQTTEKDVLVYYKAFSSPTKHGLIGARIIKKPLHNVWDMVKDVHVRRLYDPSILSACVHQRVSSTVQLVHVVMDMSLCYLKQPRDFCCITVESKEEKCYSLCFQSVHNESMPRPTKDAVRGEVLPSAWILQPDSSHGEPVTRVIYMVQADLGAPAIPSRLLGMVSKRQASLLSSLANFFSR